MAIEITIGPARRLVAAGRIFSGERAAVRVECAAAPRALYLLGDRREPVAACLEFAPDGEGAWTGAVETATRQVAALVEGVRAGKALLLVAALEAADGSQLALGTVSMVASAMPEELEDLPEDIIDPIARRAAIRALADGLSTGSGTQREIRAAVDSLLSRLAAFGFCLALALVPAWARAVPWEDVPPDTPVEPSALTNTPAAVAAQIAAATNAIPQPDMSDYVRKDGATMTGSLRAPSVTAGLYSSTATLRSDGVAVAGLVESALYGGSFIQITGGPWGDRYLYWPTQGGTIATRESSPYADPAPWSIAATAEASQSAADTYVVTNGDRAATWTRDVLYQDMLLGIAIQDRPPPYTYEAPTGTWEIVEDAAGAASAIEQEGTSARLVSSKAASGTVTVSYSTPSNGEQRVSVWMSQTQGKPVKVGPDYDLPGSPRHAWQTNLLARFAAIDYTQTNCYAHQYAGEPWGPEYIARSLSLYNDAGESMAVPTGPNAGFFWPALARASLARSVVREDITTAKPWQASPVLFISPHWAVQAAHWNYAPTVTICTDWDNGTFATLSASRRVVKPGGSDLALVRYKAAVPEQCIGRLVTSNTLARVSPSLFDRAAGIHYSQHGTVHPFSIGGYAAWTATEYPEATNAMHTAHGGDSGQPIALVTPGAKVIWLACHQSALDGPRLYDPENLAWIEAQLAADGEAPTYWTADELLEGDR